MLERLGHLGCSASVFPTFFTDDTNGTVSRPNSRYNFQLLTCISFQNNDFISNITNQNFRI